MGNREKQVYSCECVVDAFADSRVTLRTKADAARRTAVRLDDNVTQQDSRICEKGERIDTRTDDRERALRVEFFSQLIAVSIKNFRSEIPPRSCPIPSRSRHHPRSWRG